MSIIVDIQHLQKSFGKFKALHDVSFTVNEGEVLGFIGPNGAGKSTTIRILLGILKKDAGYATIFGKDTWIDSLDIHTKISYIPGEVNFWGGFSGGELIDIFMKLHGNGNSEKRDELIKRFDLDPKKKAKTYSKGNRQKVALISALSVDADLYIFDEPTSGLDPLMESIFQEEVDKLKAQGKAILLSSHILSEVERLADRVVIIRQGKIVETGTLDELRHLTRTSVTLIANKLERIERLAGVHDFTLTDDKASFYIDNSEMKELLKKVSRLDVKKFELTPPTLEDLFRRHYEE